MRRVLEIRNETGTVICARCFVADTFNSRLRGLMGRKELEADEALLITPSWSIHTMFMRFPIDAVFLASDLTVLATREDLKPWRVATWRRAHSVLELHAGACRRWRVLPGDRLEFAHRPEEKRNVTLMLRRGGEQVILGKGSLSAATRTIHAMSELDAGLSAVVQHDDE